MKISLVSSYRSVHQNEHALACEEGFKKLGYETAIVPCHNSVKTKNVCIWGWRASKHHTDSDRNIIVLERGYLGDRFKYTSIATNGLNGLGTFHNTKSCPSRFDTLFKDLFKPWNAEGDYILIMGQTPGDASLRGVNLMPWYEKMANDLSLIYKIPVKFRKHPNLAIKGISEKVKGTIESIGSLDEELSNARLVVTYNSNSAVDALLAGKPTYVHDKGSMAYNIANRDINNIFFDESINRKSFFNSLAWTQYTIDEIKTGEPLRNLIRE